MSDLALEQQNTAHQSTALVATNIYDPTYPGQSRPFLHEMILDVRAFDTTQGNFDGVRGAAGGNGAGLAGYGGPDGGPGVRGSSSSGDGVAGTSGISGKSGVFGFHSAEGGNGVFGKSDHGAGVSGESVSDVGVRGRSDTGDGIVGISQGEQKSGVYGFNSVHQLNRFSTGYGVFGRCDSANGFGVFGSSFYGVGVSGSSWLAVGCRGGSEKDDGVVGETAAQDKSGVFGFNTAAEGNTFGVSGTSQSPQGFGVAGFTEHGTGVRGVTRSPRGAGVLGLNDHGSGVKGVTAAVDHSGVFGENTYAPDPNRAGHRAHKGAPLLKTYGVIGKADSHAGVGVFGVSARGDGVMGQGEQYGAVFQGTLAPLYLVPSMNNGPPTNQFHRRGELFVDTSGELFFCTADGDPGTWKKVRLEAA